MTRCAKIPAELRTSADLPAVDSADIGLAHPELHSAPGGDAGFYRIPTRRILVTGVAVMMLALGGCGHEEQDNYPATSGVIVEGGVIVDGGETLPAGQNSTGQNSADSGGTILFLASPGGGKPPRLIARTNSITTAPTAEFLARKALLSWQGAPASNNGLVPLVVIAAEDDVDGPILLPTASSTTPGTTKPQTGTPQTGNRITVARPAGTDTPSANKPTILKIIQSP